MGVDVSAMCCIGKYTDDPRDFLVSCGLVTEEEAVEFEEEGWGDFSKDGLEVQAISYYSDEGYYIGFMYYGGQILEASKDLENYGKQFKKLTGVDAEINVFAQWH